MNNSVFRIGAIVRQTERSTLRKLVERPCCIVVRRIDGMPNGKYWQWEVIAGDAHPYFIQSYNEWMYEVIS